MPHLIFELMTQEQPTVNTSQNITPKPGRPKNGSRKVAAFLQSKGHLLVQPKIGAREMAAYAAAYAEAEERIQRRFASLSKRMARRLV
jgi:hypothetical protein